MIERVLRVLDWWSGRGWGIPWRCWVGRHQKWWRAGENRIVWECRRCPAGGEERYEVLTAPPRQEEGPIVYHMSGGPRL